MATLKKKRDLRNDYQKLADDIELSESEFEKLSEKEGLEEDESEFYSDMAKTLRRFCDRVQKLEEEHNDELEKLESRVDELEYDTSLTSSVLSMYEIQKAEIAKRLAENCSLELLQNVEIACANNIRRGKSPYTILPGTTSIPFELQQIVDKAC